MKEEITKIRKAVAVLANRLNNKIKDLSSAFKKAWQIIKGIVLLSKVAGTTFNNRQKALSHLSKYNPKTVNVELVREPNNQYDNNAVSVNLSVNNSKTYRSGYLPKDISLIYLIKELALKRHLEGLQVGQ